MKSHKSPLRAFLFLSAIIAMLFFNSCNKLDYGLDEAFGHGDSVTERTKYDDISPSIQKSFASPYRVLIVSDVHFGGENIEHNGARRDDDFFASAKAFGPYAFCVCLGDTAEHGWKKEFRRYKSEFCDRVASEYEIQTFTCVGNHDLYNHGYDEYKKIINPGTTFYSFSTAKISYYFLDDASGTLGSKQLNTIKRNFKADPRKKIIFMHVPIYMDNSTPYKMQDTHERNELLSVLNKNGTIAAICGHYHEGGNFDLGRFQEYLVGGYLEYSQYAVLTVDEEKGVVGVEEYSY